MSNPRKANIEAGRQLRKQRLGLIWLVVIVMVTTVLTSCNARKKNTAAARQYTAFITRYNIYYNGDKHYDETLDQMEKSYEDDYTKRLLMHPAEARAHEKMPQPSGDFNRSIEKAQKAIQLRSITKKPDKKSGKASDPAYKAWMKREEYNPFIHNAWMMMGRSQYMNGDFAGAASTFFYTSRRFSWLPQTVTEAKLWQARSYLAMGWDFEAENIISRIKTEELTNNDLRYLYNLDFAELYIHGNEYAKAVPYLEEAIKHDSGAQKTRLWFLLGQLYASLGDKNAAYKAFDKVGGSSNATYRTKFNARIKQSEVFSGNDIESEVKALKRMTRYDRNKEYQDQIYYAIGNLYLSRGDTAQAISNYEEAVKKSTRGGIDKAVTQVALGNLYYNQHKYEKAQPNYSEGVPQLGDEYPDIATLRLRSDVLDELALYSQNVTLQDSLLRLAALPEAERLKVIDKIIEDLKKKEKEEAEEARRAEYLAQQQSQGSQLQNGNAAQTNTFTLNSDGSWYFYNPATRNAGKTDFQRRWGSRKLEDDWRRRNKTTFNTSEFGDDDDTDNETAQIPGDNPEDNMDAETKKKSEDPHFREYYLRQIPVTETQKLVSHEIIQDGLYNMGVILKDRLEDFAASRSEFNRLLKDYPDNTNRLEVYYNMYLMAEREGKHSEAEKWRNLILTEFADSKYGVAMKDPHYLDNLRAMDSIQNKMYEDAYDAYLNNDNRAVHNAFNNMSERYPLSPLMPKFMFLHALAYATEQKTDEFNSTLRDLLERYPNTDITPIASEWLKGMAKGRELHAGKGENGNMRGMIWDIALSNDSTATSDASNVQFSLNDSDPQLLLFVFPTDQVDRNKLLYEIARHNFNSFVVKDFDLELMNFGLLGMIAVKEFENMNELNHYRRVMAQSSTFKLPPGVRPVVISVANFKALLDSGASLDAYFRFLEEQQFKDAQSDLLPYEEIETLSEVEAEEKAMLEVEKVVNTQEEIKEAEEMKEQFENETPVNSIPETKPTPQPTKTEPTVPKPSVPTNTPPNPAPSKSAPTPTKPTTPKPQPQVPTYDPGSEGDDDPLLN